MPRLSFLRLVPVLLVVVLGLAACGGSDDPEQVDAPLTQPPLTSTQETTPRPTTPTVTAPPATTTTPTTPPATTPETPDSGGAPATTPTTPEDTGGAQAPAQDDPPAQTAPAEEPQQTGGSGTPADCGQAIGGFIKGISASGADCGAATGVAGAWYEAVNQGSSPDAAIDAAGYACSGSLSGQRTAVTCAGAGGERVTFTASP